MTQSPEERRRLSNAASLRWHLENAPGPGMIGEVKPLAPGAINPMWAIEENLYSEKKGYGIMVKRGYEALKATETPKKKERMVSVHAKGQYLLKREAIEESDDLMA